MTAGSLSPDLVFRRASDVSVGTDDDLAVVFDQHAGTYHGLNAAGAFIWELLATPRTVADVAAELRHQFDVEPDAAREATQSFLKELHARGLIVQDPAS